MFQKGPNKQRGMSLNLWRSNTAAVINCDAASQEAHVNKVVVEIETEQEGLVRPMEKDPTVSRQQINPDNAALGHSFPPGWVKFP